MQCLLILLRIAPMAALVPFLALAGPVSAQEGPPVIRTYQMERAEVGGRPGLAFTWYVENVDRVRLLHDGRELEARIQLPDGSFGWPPKMPGEFRTSGTDGVYALVAENAQGRVEARGSYREGGCFVWLVPPGTHWTRCLRGGVIASNFSTNVSPGPLEQADPPDFDRVVDRRVTDARYEVEFADGTVRWQALNGGSFGTILPDGAETMSLFSQAPPPEFPRLPGTYASWGDSVETLLLGIIDQMLDPADRNEYRSLTASKPYSTRIYDHIRVIDFLAIP